jgi:hypothetical protein
MNLTVVKQLQLTNQPLLFPSTFLANWVLTDLTFVAYSITVQLV